MVINVGCFPLHTHRRVFSPTVNPVISENIPYNKENTLAGCTRPAVLSPRLFAIPRLGTGARVSCRIRSLWRGRGHNASAQRNPDVCPLLVVSFILDIRCLGLIMFSMFIQVFEWAYASPAIEGDIVACLAVSWFLFAIVVEQSAVRSAFVHWCAHGVTTFSLCWITKCMIGMELKDNKRDSEDED
jgi:hypothetical protein